MKVATGAEVWAMHALVAFVGTVPAGSARNELQCALRALANALGFDVADPSTDTLAEPRAALARLGILAASVDGLEDPQRAAASACLAWARDLLVPVILHRAGWRRDGQRPDLWIDPYAPRDLCDEGDALARLERDLAA